MLSEQGLQMSGFDVGSGNPFQQAQRDSGNGDFGRTMSERGNSHRIAGALDPTGGISAILWVIPALLVLILLIVVVLSLRRRRLSAGGR